MLRPRSLWIVAALIASGVLTATTVTYAQQPPAPQGHRMFSGLQRNLGLTDDQVNSLAFESEKVQTELRQLVLNGGDANAIAAKKAQVAQLIGQGLDMRIQTLQQIGPILTQEQRDKLAQLGPGAMWRGHRHHKPAQQG